MRGAGCGVREAGSGVTGYVEKTGSVVFVPTAHDQRSHHCHLVSFPKMSKCQARLLVMNNRIYISKSISVQKITNFRDLSTRRRYAKSVIIIIIIIFIIYTR